MSKKPTEKQMETIVSARKNAIMILQSCEEFEDGTIDAEKWEERISKASLIAPTPLKF